MSLRSPRIRVHILPLYRSAAQTIVATLQTQNTISHFSNENRNSAAKARPTTMNQVNSLPQLISTTLYREAALSEMNYMEILFSVAAFLFYGRIHLLVVPPLFVEKYLSSFSEKLALYLLKNRKISFPIQKTSISMRVFDIFTRENFLHVISLTNTEICHMTCGVLSTDYIRPPVRRHNLR